MRGVSSSSNVRADLCQAHAFVLRSQYVSEEKRERWLVVTIPHGIIPDIIPTAEVKDGLTPASQCTVALSSSDD